MDNKQNFESNLKELESIVKALEGSDISLEEMLEMFEKGIKLTKACTNALDSAEQKITILMKNRDNGEMVEEDFVGVGE